MQGASEGDDDYLHPVDLETSDPLAHPPHHYYSNNLAANQVVYKLMVVFHQCWKGFETTMREINPPLSLSTFPFPPLTPSPLSIPFPCLFRALPSPSFRFA